MEKCTGPLVMGVILGFIALMVYLTFSSKENWKSYETLLEATPKSDEDEIERLEKMVKVFKALYFTLLALTILVTCSICCLISRILLAIKIIQACADFVLEVKAVLAVPLVVTAFTVGYLLFWLYWTALTYSQGTLVQIKSLPFMIIEISKEVRN